MEATFEHRNSSKGLLVAVLLAVLAFTIFVNVRSSHAWIQHGQGATQAQRCVRDNGTVAVFSENKSRYLHLICVDPNSHRLFDVIISRLLRIDGSDFSEADMVTGYPPEGAGAKGVAQYIQHLTDTVGGKLVNLHFDSGEVFFVPAK